MVAFYVILGVVAVIAAILLLFPLHVRGEFEITVEKAFLKLSFFKWNKEFSKRFKKNAAAAKETVARAPEEKKDLQKSPAMPERVSSETAKTENVKTEDAKIGDAVKADSTVLEVHKPEVAKNENQNSGKLDSEKAQTAIKPKEKSKLQLEENPKQKAREISRSRESEKRRKKREKLLAKSAAKKAKSEKKSEKDDSSELNDKDFFTLLLQPNMVSLAWKYAKKLLGNTLTLFRFKFFDSYVEGIDTGSPEKNGYLAALLGSLPSVFPALSGFVFVMNWDGTVKLGGFGKFTASINLLRILAWILVTAYIAGRVALLYFWMRRKYKKDASKFKLSFVRRKIVDFIASED